VRRVAAIVCTLAAAAGLLIASSAPGDDGGAYEVRAIFDNGAFLVPGEEVRIAGAKVGEVAEVDVSREDEVVSLEDGGKAIPGKAVVVLRIDDPAFQDFREDASCLARPQSLLGERYVQCKNTEPRAPGTEPPPPLEEIPEGQPGEGQLLLPLENNGKAVDLDLVQNINRRPYADRFRLILNDLGAGLAARGDELAEIIERSNPALRETDEVLAILAAQNQALAQLAEDSDTVLAPLARERDAVTGFIANANETAQATAERSGDLEAGLQRFPGALRELRLTMAQLDAFAEQATPVISDLGDAAPDLTRATEALGPFSNAATESLTTLGDAAETAGPKLAAADPVILDLRTLAKRTKPGARSLATLLRSVRETDGIERIMDLIFFTTGGFNGFDSLGHYMRALLLVTNCVDYVAAPLTGCSANWAEAVPSQEPKLSPQRAGEEPDDGAPGAEPLPSPGTQIPGFELPGPEAPGTPPLPELQPPGDDEALPPPGDEPGGSGAQPDGGSEGQPDQGSGAAEDATLGRRMRVARALLRFLMEDS
jgi:phospholipid/cholesterol/gamma-HCH transport system substrate-binding protein